MQFFRYMNETYRPHRFDPQVATLYGVPAALILQYIVWRSTHGPKWVPLSINSLAGQYPYMGRDECARALGKLLRPGRKTPALVHRKAEDQGCGYLYAPAFEPRKVDLGSLHTFNAILAEKVGYVPALVYHNISFWIKHNWKEKAEELYTYLNPIEFNDSDLEMQRFSYKNTRRAASHSGTVPKWQKHHKYVPMRSAWRGFICLQESGFLVKKPGRSRIPIWTLPKQDLTAFQVQMLSNSNLEIHNAKTKRLLPKPNDLCQNQTTSAKTKRLLPTKRSVSAGCTSVDEAIVEASTAHAVLLKPNEDQRDAVPADSPLADARCESAGTASLRPSSSTPVRTTKRKHSVKTSVIEKLDCLRLPVVKKKVLKDSFGHPSKRKYVRRPGLDDPELDAYLDDLTPEDRMNYMESLQGR